MDVLELNGVTYVKASSIARDLGYTADYVGQLCRSGKVDAQLVGRSWFVSEESIHSHKGSRYRSSVAKTKKDLVEQKKLVVDTAKGSEVEKKVPLTLNSQNFYNKISLGESKYIEDKSDLIPVLTERKSESTTEIEIRHADAKTIPVKRGFMSYSLEATDLPKIRFKGSLKLEEAEERPVAEDTEETKDEEKERRKVADTLTTTEEKGGDKIEPKKTTKLKVENKEKETKVKIHLKRSKKASKKKTVHISPRVTGTLQVVKVATHHSASPTMTVRYLAVSVLLALTLSAGLLFVDSTIILNSAESMLSIDYSINVSATIDSLFR